MSHVSIEANRIAAAARHPETLRLAKELQQKHYGKKIIVGVDACQRLSGVALKLAAFDKLLSDSRQVVDIEVFTCFIDSFDIRYCIASYC